MSRDRRCKTGEQPSLAPLVAMPAMMCVVLVVLFVLILPNAFYSPGEVYESSNVTNVSTSKRTGLLCALGGASSSDEYEISLQDGGVRTFARNELAVKLGSDASVPLLERVGGSDRFKSQYVFVLPDGYDVDGDESGSSV